MLYSGSEILDKEKGVFFWAPKGLISSILLEEIRFEESIFFEDALFGMQLFLEANRILIINKALRIYRIRKNSISQHTLKKEYNEFNNTTVFSKTQSDIVQILKDPHKIQRYIFFYAMAITAHKLHCLKQSTKITNLQKQIIQDKILECAKFAFCGCQFEKDPRNVREICSKLLDYTSRIRWSSKLAYHYPKVFRILKKAKTLIGG